MAALDEEDWTVDIKSLQIKAASLEDADSASPPKIATNAPPMRLLSRAQPQDELTSGTLHRGPEAVSQMQRSGEETVDSALLTAMETPRDRMQLLQLEKNMFQFVKSSEREMEMPPMHNSFWQLLCFRLGERFRLAHRASDSMSETGQRGITFLKTSDTSMPRRFLYEVEVREREVESFVGRSGNDFAASSQERDGGQAQGAGGQKKVMLMQRSAPKPNARGPERAAKDGNGLTSAGDREKAYAEARARIFGEEASSPSGSSTPPTPADSDSPTHAPTQRPAEPSSSGAGASARPSQKKVQVQDPSKWTGKKSITREHDQGRYDPDFQRNVPSSSGAVAGPPSGPMGAPPMHALGPAAMDPRANPYYAQPLPGPPFAAPLPPGYFPPPSYYPQPHPGQYQFDFPPGNLTNSGAFSRQSPPPPLQDPKAFPPLS